jgi:hypothetical protein
MVMVDLHLACHTDNNWQSVTWGTEQKLLGE